MRRREFGVGGSREFGLLFRGDHVMIRYWDGQATIGGTIKGRNDEIGTMMTEMREYGFSARYIARKGNLLL